MINRRLLIGATLASSILVGGAAVAQQGQPIVGISTVTTYAADARITAVDTANRTVSLAFDNGATAVRKVGPTVANFAQTKVGDMVTVAFEDRLTFVLSGPNAKVPRGRDVSATIAAAGPKSAAGASADQAVANWWVTGVNASAGTISLVNPAGGQVRTYNVATPAGREQLQRVKPGDYLTAIDSQIAVVAITPK
ncbi:MAG: hypothetical protein ACOY4R_20160 [Pseudomonadota bacterium]